MSATSRVADLAVQYAERRLSDAPSKQKRGQR